MSTPLELLPNRRGHVVLNKKDEAEKPECGRSTLPGVISQRACAFYGARWMLAAIPDVVHLVHGPVGCAYYGRTVRRTNYRIFSSNLAERDIVFGAGDKLYNSIREAVRQFSGTRAVIVYATCVVGITGEDLSAICNRASTDLGLPVVPVNCPGFCGTSQATGHDIAVNVLLEHFIVKGDKKEPPLDNTVNILGEFDVQGDLGEIEALLGQLGINIICTFSGRASTTAMANSHRAKLNIVHCRRTGQALAEAMHDRFHIPFLKVSFFGLEETTAALRAIGEFFGSDKTEKVIAQEVKKARRGIEPFLPGLAGKRVALFFGASRMGSMAKAFQELGMEVIMAGSQFGCRQDYREAGDKVKEGVLLMDDVHDRELEELLTKYRPDLLVGGTKEKYMAHKLGVPFLVFPQEMSPFAGFNGFVNLAREVSGIMGAPVWRLAQSRREVSKLKVAVASGNGLTIDQHFGKAEQFMIFELTPNSVSLLEVRRPAVKENVSYQDSGGKDGVRQRIDLLADCRAVLCTRAGECAREQAGNTGLTVLEKEGPLSEALKWCSSVL